MKRLAETSLLQWKADPRRKPLIIRGGRQVGKTYTVEQFGREHFKATLKVDLEKRMDLHSLFQGNLDPKALLRELALIFRQEIIPGETLLFFDEIQTCPRALMALRYLYEEAAAFHVIAAGSLLEFALGEISFPVGRVQFLNMYPMTFAEFVLAGGNEPLFEFLREPATPPAEAAHQSISRQLKDYFFVGGMPEVVRAYHETGMLRAFEAQSEILSALRQDFSKYTPRVDPGCLDQVLERCAVGMGEQIKYSRLADGFSNPTIHKAFDVLRMAQVLHKIPAVKAPGLPLGAQANHRKFKAAVLDIGLMQRLARLPVDVEIRHEHLLNIYRGKLAEQFVAQEFSAQQNGELYYWAREARNAAAEVDYLFQKDGQVYPVEVKSGEGGTLRSMHLMLHSYPECKEGVVFYGGPYGERSEQKLRFVPLYLAGSLASLPLGGVLA